MKVPDKRTLQDLYADEKISPVVVKLAFECANRMAVERLCLAFRDELDRRAQFQKQKVTHLDGRLVVRTSLIKHAIMRILMIMNQMEGEQYPGEFMVEAIGRLMDVPREIYDPTSEGAGSSEEKELVILLDAANPKRSAYQVHKLSGVNHMTVRAWRQEPEFRRKVRLLASTSNLEMLEKRAIQIRQKRERADAKYKAFGIKNEQLLREWAAEKYKDKIG